jgi:mRNA interferase RelE/StbE
MSKTYLLQIEKPALKTLEKLPLKIFKQVVTKLFALQANPKPQDCKKLKGYSGGYRVDQGEYRILYTIEGEKIRVFRVGKRNDGEVYRNL